MKNKKSTSTVNPRGRGPYNVACDVCARKKIKCDGIKPVCQPCQTQGREKECTRTKNPGRKPRLEASVEAVHKQAEILLKCTTDTRHYTEFLEKQLDECYQHLPQHRIDFRASRPADPDGLMAQPGDDRDDLDLMGEDENDQGSDDGNDPTVTAICIPPQSLEVEPFTQPSRFPALAENPDDTYVLYVDGVQASHYNPNFDWSRHLAPDVQCKLDRPTHDKALDLLFKFVTPWCLRIVPALFLKDMFRELSVPPSQEPPKTPHYSPMLHNALVALALAFLDEPCSEMKARQCYAKYAKDLIESECRKPNLSVVQALSILASFHSSQGDQALGYLYFGMSARISQTLGLNIDCSEWVKLGLMDEAERLDRHWASCTNFAQDVCWSLYVGRDFCVTEPLGAKAISLPHVDPELDKIPWFHLPAAIAPQPNNLTIIFEASCKLLKIAHPIMDLMNRLNKARSRPLLLDAWINDIDDQLNMWKSSLTDELDITPQSLLTQTPHKLMLHLAYWWLTILLHRPFFDRKSQPIHSTDRETDHVKLCHRAAECIMDLLGTWHKLYTLRYCPVCIIQTVFSAGTVYLFIAVQASSGIRDAQKELRPSLDQLALVQQYLHKIGMSWSCATNVSETLRNLMDERVRPLLDIFDRKNASAGLHISDIGDEEENDSSLSRSSSRKRSPTIKMKPHQRLSSLSNPSNHALTSSISSTQVSPSQADPSNSPTVTISSTPDTSSTHAAPSAPIAIQSTSSKPSSFSDSLSLRPDPGASPDSNYPAFVHPGFQGYPFSNYTDNPFSGNGEHVRLPFGDQGSAHNIQPSSSPSFRSPSVTGYLGMLGGQTLPEAPFVGLFNEIDSHGHSSNFSNALFGAGFLNHGPDSSSGKHVLSSHGENDMDLDNLPWRQSFPS